jgi:hypothetical protein
LRASAVHSQTMQPPGPRSREETRRLATAFSLENLARAEARDTSSLTVSSEDWMPPSPTKLLRRLTLRGPASNTVEPGLTSSANPGAALASPSRQISRLFGRSAPPTHNIPSPRLRSKAPPWLSTAGGGRTPGIDTNVEPQRSTSPLKRLRELRQQLGRSGKLPETAAAADAAAQFYVGTPEARAARPVPAESRLTAQVAARVAPALAGKRLDGTVARANAARLGASPPWRPTVEVVAAVEPNYHPHFVRPPSTASAPTPWAASKQQAAAAAAAAAAPPPGAAAAAAAAAAGRRNTCQTYDQERNAVKQRRLDDARRASLAKAPPKPAVRDPEPSAVTAALASLARDNTASTAHKNKLGAYHDVLASAAETAIYELGKLGAQDTVQKEAAALTAVDIGTLVECFAEADADMSGQIEEAEWPTALEAMKRRWPNEPHSVAEVAGSGFSGTHERLTEAQVIFRQLDLDCDGKVSFSEFVLHRQRQHWVRLRARKALSTRSEGQLAAERLVTAKLHANITQISQLQTAESMRGWGG